MKVSAIILILLMSSTGAAAFDPTGVRTDCSWWGNFDKFNEVGIDPMLPKLSYVAGVYDGLVFGKSQIRDNFVFTSYETMSEGLDEFCADTRNQRVSLVPALRIVSMGIKGRSKEAIERETRRLRAQASETRR
ncbi:MAG: hypothetical protein PVI91_12050 [Gammaproteobacteria bacterium]